MFVLMLLTVLIVVVRIGGNMNQVQWIYRDGGYFHETEFFMSPKRSFTSTHEIWEYSKNCWVCTDRSIMTNDEPRNMRGFLPTPEAVMKMEADFDELVDEILDELKARGTVK